MNPTDRSFLLDVAYGGWQRCTYLEKQLPGLALDRIALARIEIERAVADYLRMEQEPDVERTPAQ